MPHDGVYKQALTVVDAASRYKQAEPLETKSSTEDASAFERIFHRGPLYWPKFLQADHGKEFQDVVLSTMKHHNVPIRRGLTALHRDQAIVEHIV